MSLYNELKHERRLLTGSTGQGGVCQHTEETTLAHLIVLWEMAHLIVLWGKEHGFPQVSPTRVQ